MAAASTTPSVALVLLLSEKRGALLMHEGMKILISAIGEMALA
jgi:hypothetical protein